MYYWTDEIADKHKLWSKSIPPRPKFRSQRRLAQNKGSPEQNGRYPARAARHCCTMNAKRKAGSELPQTAGKKLLVDGDRTLGKPSA